MTPPAGARYRLGLALRSLDSARLVAVRLARAVGCGLDALADSQAAPERAALGLVVRILRGRSNADVERALWVLQALFR